MRKNILNLFLTAGFFLFYSCGASAPIITLDDQLLQKYQEAKVAYFNGALENAEKAFREITEKRGDFFQARFMLGKTLYSTGKTDEAEKTFLFLVEKYPQYHEAEVWLVRSEIANKKTIAAEKRLQEMLAFDSNDPRLLSLYAKISELKSDTTNALQYYQLSTQYEEELAFSHFEIARYYYQFGLEEKALLEIDKCLLLLPYENTLRNSVLDLKKSILEKSEKTNENE